MSDIVIGVTGGIGSGKTTVTDAFAALGIDVVDADVIAREVVAADSPALAQIREYFGDAVIAADGSLNRAALRQRVFANDAHKQWLNQLLHPLIRARIEASLAHATSPYCLLSAPLLLENKLTHLCNRVLVVDVTEATQIARTIARDDNSEAQVRAIMQAQISRAERCAAADDIIDNDGPLQQLDAQVKALHQQYLKLAKSGRHA